MSRWKWHSPSTGEPATVFRVDHCLTVTEIADLLCTWTSLETGTSLSQAALVHYVHCALEAAPVLEPVEYWAGGYTEEDAAARLKWALGQARKFYEKTGGEAQCPGASER